MATLTSQQFEDDLRPIFRGRLHTDEITRGLYSTDASPFQILPLAVAVPEHEDDLKQLLRYCQENTLAVIPRGAGTGLAGESLGSGVIVDLSMHFRKILEIQHDSVRVQPGVVYAELNRELAKVGRRFAPDPASGASCTLGGMIANNASGGTAFRHGYTRDHVQALKVMWDVGELDWLEPPTASSTISFLLQTRREQVRQLLIANRDLIELTRPHTAYNRCAYLLHDVMTPEGPDLTRLMVGTEGTLALITEARLKTIPLAGGVCVFVLGFATLDAALKVGLELRGCTGIASCDLLDQRLLSLARAARSSDTGLSTLVAGAALIVTFEAESEKAALRLGKAAIDSLRGTSSLVVLADPTCDPEGARRIRTFREAAVSGLYALNSGRRPEAFIEDVGVPGEEIGRFISAVQEILRAEGITASFLVHALTGQIHTRPLVDLSDPNDRSRLWSIGEKVHAIALSMNGTISTQHAVGIARTPWVEKQYGPLMPVFRELKRIFDPRAILNPGKLLGPDPSRPAWPLRESSKSETHGSERPSHTDITKPGTSLLLWSSSPEREAAKCNNCGDCRPRGTTTRMCPIYRINGSERATPRAKANLLRLQSSKLISTPPTSDEVRELADLCINCKMCHSDCRAGVDVPKLMLEAKAVHQAENGLSRDEWFLAHLEAFAALGSHFTFSSNALLGSVWSRWLLEKLLGLSRRRLLTRFTFRTFLGRARKLGLTRRGDSKRPKLAYFVDMYANRNDPLIALATVEVLRINGFEVYVPRQQRSSGMAPLAVGDVDTARDIAAYNVRTFADLVRDGYQIICSEPSAALALSQDYLSLLNDADTALVAANTHELTAFLGRLLDSGDLKPPTRELPWSLGHHVPCHVKSRGGMPAGPRLLAQIPKLTVHTVDVSCSGMAGTWGLLAKNFADSRQIGQPMIEEIDRPRVWFGSTECSSCRMQMQEGTGKRTLHPVQYLALSYGLLPEIERLLTKPLKPLLTD